jgi:preprotein translocase subunit SecG
MSTTIIAIILILVCVILAFLVLIQNPKGGGLAGGIGGLGQQMMGVQQSTDTVEKGTWMFAGAMALLCLLTAFANSGKNKNGKFEKSRSEEAVKNAPLPAAPAAPAQTTAPMPGTQATSANAAPATATAAPAPANAAPATKTP